MNRQPMQHNKYLLHACLSFLLLTFGVLAAANPSAEPKVGDYCPGSDVLLVSAEELSVSLDLAVRSRAALRQKDVAAAARELISVGTTLRLAASRGAAARTNLLIDAIVQSKGSENYAQLLTWIPLLQRSLRTLPDDATVSAARDWIGAAEDIMQGEKEGNPEMPLKEARHLLACDGLDIPLGQAIVEQGKLMKQLRQEVKNSSYKELLDALRSALTYALESSKR